MRASEQERFWSKVEFDECWTWMASRHAEGYGHFKSSKGVVVRAHRFAYESTVGPIPDGLELDHLCRNRACVNPAHLEAVPKRTNILRGVGQGALNARKTHCPQGHEYDDENTGRDRNGNRYCRACMTERNRRRKVA